MAPNSAMVYDSATARGSVLAEVRELIRYRDFLKFLIAKTLTSRYKRSVLGVAWTLLNPLIQMVVLSVAFSALFRSKIPYYPVYVLLGLTVWMFFNQSTAFAMGQLSAGGGLMQKVYLPHTAFAVASVANGIVNFGFALVPLVAIMLVLGHPFHATWWFLPIALAILAAFSLGVALLVSSVAVFFADVKDMYGLLLQAVFYLTPIIYPKELLASRFPLVVALNPIAYMIEIVRKPIYEGQLPDSHTLGVAVLVAAFTLILGSWIFTRRADEFSYYI